MTDPIRPRWCIRFQDSDIADETRDLASAYARLSRITIGRAVHLALKELVEGRLGIGLTNNLMLMGKLTRLTQHGR